MSNIFTEFARLYLGPGEVLTAPQAESLLERILGERGSYWVPVWYDLATPGYLDVQVGSGKGAGLYHLEVEELVQFEEIWVRFADEGTDADVIYEWAPVLGESAFDGYRRRRPCRYAFDEVRIVSRDQTLLRRLPEGLPWEETAEGYRVACAGTHLALNERIDMAVGPGARFGTDVERTAGGLPTPTTPCHGGSTPVRAVEPGELGAWVQRGDRTITRLDLLHAGRIVHRAAWGRRYERSPEDEWLSQCADGWDNCADELFVRVRGA
ncbi:hypothetical protein [Polyangium mundeleinium]|uniref:Uncharacterized protein n=1 Tax=Polyangium mundeleinium TaxID=2995306 RepID=A0ABT5EUI3_9BACT|nr:hypothetical protein [Polyangium mundeleinium]MDC0745486.1 hypothetical protein [Polyangium mundeleinium]